MAKYVWEYCCLVSGVFFLKWSGVFLLHNPVRVDWNPSSYLSGIRACLVFFVRSWPHVVYLELWKDQIQKRRD